MAQPTKTNVPTTNTSDYVVRLDRLGQEADWVDCPFCHTRVKTKVVHESSTATALAGCVCFLICCLGAIIPFICGWCEDTSHVCTRCGKTVMMMSHDGPAQALGSQQGGVREVSRYANSQGLEVNAPGSVSGMSTIQQPPAELSQLRPIPTQPPPAYVSGDGPRVASVANAQPQPEEASVATK